MRQPTLHGQVFEQTEFLIRNFFKFFKFIKSYFYAEENLIDLLFILIYLLEQLSLILFLQITQYHEAVISTFIAILLSTIAIEKTLLKSRNKRLKEKLTAIETTYKNHITIIEKSIQKDKT